MQGFIQLNRSKETAELMKDYPCYMLLSLIAYRAKRTNEFTVYNLKPCEALIGDYRSCGLTEQKYRTAKKKLEEWNFATFKATSKGTIATLTDTRIYNINVDEDSEQTNELATNEQRTANGQATTNNNVKNVNNDKNVKKKNGFFSQQMIDNFYYLKDKEFLRTITDYQNTRKKLRKPLAGRALEITLTKLHRVDISTAITMLENSIEGGWSKIYPIREVEPGTEHLTKAQRANRESWKRWEASNGYHEEETGKYDAINTVINV